MPPPRMNSKLFHKLWNALPVSCCDRNFWILLETLWGSFLSADPTPFEHESFFSLANMGRDMHASIESIHPGVLEACSASRELYDTFSLWNPFALSALLQIPISTVVEQLLLAVEKRWMEIRFVVCCMSCAYDITHSTTVSELGVGGPRHVAKTFRCPMCTDSTAVHTLNDIYVFFRLKNLLPVFERDHYRLSCTKVAAKQKLESIFCPAGARFAITLQLPEGRYLLAAPFIPALLELEVMIGFEDLPPRERNIIQVVDLKKYSRIREMESTRTTQLEYQKKMSLRSTHVKQSTMVSTSLSQVGRPSGFYAETAVGRRDPITLRPRAGRASFVSSSISNGFGLGDHTGNYSGEHEEELDPLNEALLQCLTLKHGKVKLLFYNDTASSGFVDLFVSFERWAEFTAEVYPKQLRVSEFMHYVPRGIRSKIMRCCVPKPAFTIPTEGIFVRHSFDLSYNYFKDPYVVSVIQEVHRYSLEDHHGLLLNVSDGGTMYDSSFFSITAAIASSMCFFQRVLLRLGDDVALSMRCSINNAPLHITTYQVQYNDVENMRSSYPDVQFVGPAVYYSSHPSVVPPTLYAFEQELPRTVAKKTKYVHTVLNFNPFELSEEERQRELLLNISKEKSTMVRFEIRNFSAPSTTARPSILPATLKETPKYFTVKCNNSREASQELPLAVSFQEFIDEVNGADSALTASNIGNYINLSSQDTVLPYFLTYLCERLEGTTIEKMSSGFVILVPLPALQASVQLPALLDSSCYQQVLSGPF